MGRGPHCPGQRGPCWEGVPCAPGIPVLCSHGEFPRRAQPSLLPPSDFVPGLDSPAWSDNLFLLFGDVGKS